MRIFKDKNGADWPIEIDLSVVTRVYRDTGINLNDLILTDKHAKLGDDPETLGRLLWSLCESTARERSIAPEAFPRIFNGDALEEAMNALADACADFFPSGRRSLARNVIEKGKAFQTAALAAAQTTLASLNVDEMVKSLSAGSSNSQPSQG